MSKCRFAVSRFPNERFIQKGGTLEGRFRIAFVVTPQGATLHFVSKELPYPLASLPYSDTRYMAAFTQSFLPAILRQQLNRLLLFPYSTAVALPEDLALQAGKVFDHMIQAQASCYLFKYDQIRNYLAELMHIAFKAQSNVV